MPDIVVHHAMGERVLECLKPEICAWIDPSVFTVSVMGPDPYFYYRFFVPHFRCGVNRRGVTMHRVKTGQFLMELAKKSRSRENFSFLAGFLCHYALDAVAHPYIIGKAEHRRYMHRAIEHRLDVKELERQGKQLPDIMKLFASFPDLPDVKQTIADVYGWKDNCFQVGYLHMKVFHWIVKDRHGIMNRLLCRAEGRYASLSFQTHLADGLDLSGFSELEEQAVKLGADLITAAYQFRNGEIREEELKRMIGNRSYSGDEAEI